MRQPPASRMSDPQAQAATALWRFSLAVYLRAGVAPECLDVQERFGVDVKLLLFCAYLGALEAGVLSQDDLAQAAAVGAARRGEGLRTPRRTRPAAPTLRQAR